MTSRYRTDLDGADIDRAAIDRAVVALRAGGIVCIPTESSYGLAVDPASAEALDALAALKGRPEHAPFALIAGDLAQAQAWTGAWPALARDLAEEHWPGPLTLVLPPAAHVLPVLLGPTGGIGLRVSSMALTRELALALGRPITATSANPSGEPPATTLDQARSYFPGGFAAEFDGGQCSAQASTLVAFAPGGQAQVLREGPISLPSLEDN